MSGLEQATRGFLGGGGGSGPIILVTTTPNPNQVVLEWNGPVSPTPFALADFALAFAITPPPAHGAVSVIGVAMSDTTHMVLTTTDQANGATYSLAVATGVVTDNSSSLANSATVVSFTGNNVALTVSNHHLVDATNLTVTFSRAVQSGTAIIPVNYVFAPPLGVDLVERITDTMYLVKTARMQPNTIYNVTVSGVLALDGASI